MPGCGFGRVRRNHRGRRRPPDAMSCAIRAYDERNPGQPDHRSFDLSATTGSFEKNGEKDRGEEHSGWIRRTKAVK